MPDQKPVLKLVLDVKTRWNSLPPMIKRFLILEKSIRKALVDSGSDTAELWSFSSADLALLRRLADLLEPVEMVVKALCREDVTLFQADASIKFVLKKLIDQGAECDILGSPFHSNLATRFQQRHSDFATVAQYLANPLYEHELEKLLCRLNDEGFVPMSSTKREDMIVHIAENVSGILSGKVSSVAQRAPDQDTEMIVVDLDEEAVDNPEEVTNCSSSDNTAKASCLQDELQQELDKANKLAHATPSPVSLPSRTVRSIVKKEIAVLEASGQRGALLDKVFTALMGTRPTSVDIERVFSSCARICTPEKNRLNDDTLDALSFLCSFFKGEKKTEK